MRALIFLALVVLLLAILGWINFSREPGRASINIETNEIRDDTQKALQSGSNVLQDAKQAVDSPQDQPSQNEPAR